MSSRYLFFINLKINKANQSNNTTNFTNWLYCTKSGTLCQKMTLLKFYQHETKLVNHLRWLRI